MHQEPGERRDFLPDFVAHITQHGAEVVLEEGYGSGMAITAEEYCAVGNGVRFAPLQAVYEQDYVIVLRYPGDEKVRWMHPGACLIAMLHYPTRPQRVAFLRDQGIEAVSMDSIKDDVGRRVVENLRAVGWNGVQTAFDVLAKVYPPPGIEDATRNPVKATVLGAGAVGMYAIQAAVRYGNEPFWKKMASEGVTGVQVTVVEYDTTNHASIMMQILKYTDLLIDATQRPDPSRPVIPNDWIGVMRPHAVLLDLSVDPYFCTGDGPQIVKGIEGIPQGNLDQYVFSPDDPAWESLPECIGNRNRRWAVSCYSWPGVRPRDCMEVYGKQMAPLLQTILEAGGVANVRPDGSYFDRAVSRAVLSTWKG
jgi:alanine dehydrogenase